MSDCPTPAAQPSAGAELRAGDYPIRRGEALGLMVDAGSSVIYNPPMVCASLRLMKTIGSRGVAVGPEGVRVR